MAHEIEFTNSIDQTDIWAAIFYNEAGTMKVYNVISEEWETWIDNPSDVMNYDITLVEFGGGKYTGTFPPSIIAGNYSIVIYQGSAFDGTNEPVGGDSFYWDGTNLISNSNVITMASTALDTISTSEPSGRASTFREMIVQLYMRFFNKTTLDNNNLKVYTEGSSVNTTQSVSDTGTTQTVNKA